MPQGIASFFSYTAPIQAKALVGRHGPLDLAEAPGRRPSSSALLVGSAGNHFVEGADFHLGAELGHQVRGVQGVAKVHQLPDPLLVAQLLVG